MRGFEVCKDCSLIVSDLCESLGLSSWIPRRETPKSAGYDLRSIEDIDIQPGQVALIGTGLTAYMLDDEELQIRCRSGIAKKGIILANGVGTVDADYYGNHIKVMLKNTTSEVFHIATGDRIAQAVFGKYLTVDQDDPAKKERSGGFGSTGLK